eukprot:TRINITY_DN2372_c0_g1_i1.p1 TRINITY_DN2372_c0_g1~~TRINITY_DN2372_c0_g1_i1.p1  ORF type:complete len:488 (+),score=147.16 TRINITY_DN2372_c0_g1_i1:97-1464(+)
MFADIGPENSFTEIESLCMNCEEQGVTRLLLTRIPFFREIILMAFTCPHCGWRSNEIQNGGIIQEKGVHIELAVGPEDMNRQIVKSDSGNLRIPELDFEIPSITQKGQLNTIEGFLMQSHEAISAGQDARREIDPETTKRIDEFLERLDKCRQGDMPFTVVLDDPAGNSYIENPHAPKEDPKMKVEHYKRTDEQNWSIGLQSDETAEDQALKEFQEKKSETGNYAVGNFDAYDGAKEVMVFPGNCSGCHLPCDTRMLNVEIPFFKEVIIMATNCDSCGFKSSEVKAGGAISEKGKRLILKVESPEDLNRNVLKSETGTVIIPELDFEVTRGTLGGRFTTVEGLLTGLRDDLKGANPFAAGDSSDASSRSLYAQFIDKLALYASGSEKFVLILDDPVANSFIENPNAPDPDPNLTVEEYDRTFEQNEDLGLNDMKTENYESDKEGKEEKDDGKDES